MALLFVAGDYYHWQETNTSGYPMDKKKRKLNTAEKTEKKKRREE